MLMLQVSELAEALEEHREGNKPVWFEVSVPATASDFDQAIFQQYTQDVSEGLDPPQEVLDFLDSKGYRKPEGVAVELGDAIIRELDTMIEILKDTGYTVDQVIEIKMAYNRSRPHKHGKAY